MVIIRVAITRVAIILGGNCPGGNYPGGSYPGGNCPVTLLLSRKRKSKGEVSHVSTLRHSQRIIKIL